MNVRAPRLIALALSFAFAFAAQPVAAAQEPPRQTAAFGFTSTDPGSSTGAQLDVQIRDPQDPNAKPRTLQRIVLAYPQSTLFDFTVPERCDASDADLQSQGAAACPPRSIVARGRLDTDTGSPGGFPRYVENDLTTFNAGDGELVTLAESKGEPRTRMVGRSRVQGSTVSIDFPAVPGNPPPEPFLAYRRFALGGGPIAGGGRAYLTTPPTCPSIGAWTGSMEFVYRDGVTQKATVRTPCRRAGEPAFRAPVASVPPPDDDPPFEEPRAAEPPQVRVTGAPRGGRCVRRSFVLRVAVTSEAPLRHATVELDGKRLRVARRAPFRVRVSVRRLSRGRHLIDVLARDRSGDLGARSVRFRRC